MSKKKACVLIDFPSFPLISQRRNSRFAMAQNVLPKPPLSTKVLTLSCMTARIVPVVTPHHPAGAPHAVFAGGSSLVSHILARGNTPATQKPALSSDPLLAEIMASLRRRFAALNTHYEAAWTESWTHRRCEHPHETLLDAARCAQPHGAGWYVFAVEYGSPRQLTEAEDQLVDQFRFSHRARHYPN